MQITRNTLETSAGPGDWLTGTVFIDSVTAPSEASPVGAAGGAFHPRGRALPGTSTRTVRRSGLPRALACASGRAARSR